MKHNKGEFTISLSKADQRKLDALRREGGGKSRTAVVRELIREKHDSPGVGGKLAQMAKSIGGATGKVVAKDDAKNTP